MTKIEYIRTKIEDLIYQISPGSVDSDEIVSELIKINDVINEKITNFDIVKKMDCNELSNWYVEFDKCQYCDYDGKGYNCADEGCKRAVWLYLTEETDDAY